MCDVLHLVSVAGYDYILPIETSVMFLVSDVPSPPSSMCIDVVILDDDDYEGNQTFTMTIIGTSLTPPAIISGEDVVITILDNNG